MVERLDFLWGWPIFRCELLVSGSVLPGYTLLRHDASFMRIPMYQPGFHEIRWLEISMIFDRYICCHGFYTKVVYQETNLHDLVTLGVEGDVSTYHILLRICEAYIYIYIYMYICD